MTITAVPIGGGLPFAKAIAVGSMSRNAMGDFLFGSGGVVPPPDVLIPLSRITTWKPGVTYNGGIPTGRTQSGATLSPLGQKGTFTGTTTLFNNTLTISGLVGVVLDCLIFDAALTQCFGWVTAGAGTTWTFNDNCRTAATGIAMVAYGNDTPQINAAFSGAAANTFVKLANGTFNIAGNGLGLNKDNVTLRGSSQWTGKEIISGQMPPLSQTATTILWKADHGLSPYGCLYSGFGVGAMQWGTSYSLAADAAKGANTLTLTAPFGGAIGDLIIVDMIGSPDPNMFWGNRNDLSGTFTGSLSGSTVLAMTAPINGPAGVDGAANVTFSTTNMTVNSTAQNSFWNVMGPSMNPFGVTVFDTANVFKGYITGGGPTTFTMSQSNSGTMNVNLGGVIPQTNYPVFDGNFSTFYGFIQSGNYPGPWTMDRACPNVSGTLAVGGGSRRFFTRQDRPFVQIMKVTAIAGNTLTFETPFHIDFKTAYAAQVTRFPNPNRTGIGIEDLTVYWGIGGDGNGNITLNTLQSSWVKNVQSHYSDGTGIGLYSCYRCEVRQCYAHETPSPNPGGGGYLSGLNACSDCLVEDNEMWCGNKVIVGRSTGGGNVIGYNYMDDGMGGQYPMSPEAGVNMGHMAGSHMDLMEGNYTHRFTSDAFWGNSPWQTGFRNWITGLRLGANVHVSFEVAQANTSAITAAGNDTLHFNPGDVQAVFSGLRVKSPLRYGIFFANTAVIAVNHSTGDVQLNGTLLLATAVSDEIHFWYDGPLHAYSLLQGGTTYPYADSWGRDMVAIQAHSYNNNMAGNVLGFSGQPLLGPWGGGFNFQQTSFVYQNLGPTFPPTGSDVEGYTIGQQQDPNTTYWLTGQDATLLRQGNWDWITNSQIWHGIGGAAGSGTPVAIPNSYYLSAAPTFFGANPWPWVNPATGATTVLPAKERFAARYGISSIPLAPPPQVAGTNPTIYADFVGSNYIAAGVPQMAFSDWLTALGGTFTRASVATYLQGGVVKALGAAVNGNKARFPTDLAGVPQGIRLTGAATNLHLQSQFAAGQYTFQGAGDTFVSNNAVAPDGTTTAATLTPSTTAGIHNLLYLPGWNAPVGTNTCTYSVFAKLTPGAACSTFYLDPQNGLTNAAVFNLATGAVASIIGSGTAGMQPLANGWYLCWLTFSTAQGNLNAVICALGNGTDANSRIYAGDGTSGYIFWGHQITVTSFPTDYISTTTATVTQAADSLSFPFVSSAYSALVSVQDQRNPGQTLLLDDSAGYTISYWTNVPPESIYTFNGSVVLQGPVLLPLSGVNKAMLAGNASGRKITANGNVPATDAIAISATATQNVAGTGHPILAAYGNFLQLALWNGIVASAADMQRLTT